VSAAFALQNVGDMSGLIGTTSGYHIIRLEEVLPEGAAAYDDVKDAISSDLLATKKDDTFYDLALSWKEEMSIKTYPEKYENYLDEYYSGSEASESVEPTASVQVTESAETSN
jgi:parvulin-like peptidyl-prolyl isomerase